MVSIAPWKRLRFTFRGMRFNSAPYTWISTGKSYSVKCEVPRTDRLGSVDRVQNGERELCVSARHCARKCRESSLRGIRRIRAHERASFRLESALLESARELTRSYYPETDPESCPQSIAHFSLRRRSYDIFFNHWRKYSRVFTTFISLKRETEFYIFEKIFEQMNFRVLRIKKIC